MKKIWAQAMKEIAQFRRDKLTVALAYILPVVAMLLYGYAIRLESKDISVAVINYDNSQLSREYIARIFASEQLIPVNWHGSDPYVVLDSGKAKACVTIPPEFSRKIRANISIPIQVLIDATDINNARVIENALLSINNYFMRSQGLSYIRPVVKTDLRLWFNPGRKESLYVAPGALAVFLWIFPCLLSTLAMSREKEQGTILQLYASSLTSFELMAGKTLAYLLIAISQAILLIAISSILFGLPFKGNFIAFVLIVITYLIAAICFGLTAGVRADTQSAAVQIVSTAGFSATLLLSGFMYPLRNIEYPLNLICYILPPRYAIPAFRNFFVRGSNFISQLDLLIGLLLCTIVLFLIPTLAMKRMQIRS
jgi:ABC-2 type transport system permease protein